MTTIDEFLAGFAEDPGYLDYGRVGPLSRAVAAEQQGQTEILARARYGSFDMLFREESRMRAALATVTGFPADQLVFQPNASSGLMQAMFGLSGEILLSPGEFPAVTFAAVRAAHARGVVSPRWLETDHGCVTPGRIREQLTERTSAVAVSLVDSRTGYLADIDGIRQVIGDRLLIVDAIQGFGVVDAPYLVADVVASGGQKWARAGWGTGFLALSERAIEFLTPVISGHSGVEDETWDRVPEPDRSVRAFSVSNPDPIAAARLAAAVEEIASVGVGRIQSAVSDRVGATIGLADEFAIPVVSSRDERERAGIVVLEPDNLTAMRASLHNHGLTATSRGGTIRLSVHAGTTDETLTMLSGALLSYSTTI
jgi:selenocysteine lyase/cysteine desulfurase